MNKYKVKLYPKAIQELDEIYDYIAYEKLAPDLPDKGFTDCLSTKALTNGSISINSMLNSIIQY